MYSYLLIFVFLLFNINNQPVEKKEKVAKAPKVEWNSKKIRGVVLGESDQGNIITFDERTYGDLKLRVYDFQDQSLKEKNRFKRKFGSKYTIISANNKSYLIEPRKDKKGKSLFMIHMDAEAGKYGEPVKIMDLKDFKFGNMFYSQALSADNKLGLVVLKFWKKNKPYFRYTVFNMEEPEIISQGDLPGGGGKNNLAIRKLFVGNDGDAFFFLATDKAKGDKAENAEGVSFSLIKAEKGNKKPQKIDIKTEIESSYHDLIVKPAGDGSYLVAGLAVVDKANLADQLFVLKYDADDELYESKLPKSEEEEYKEPKLNTAKGPKSEWHQDNSIYELSTTNNGSYSWHTISDYVENNDSTSYAILESGQLISASDKYRSWYFYYGGNLEVIKLDGELDKIWQKTVYKNNMIEITPEEVVILQKNNTYSMVSETYALHHKDNQLNFMFIEKGNNSKNQIYKVDTKSPFSIVIVKMDEDGDTKKYNGGAFNKKVLGKPNRMVLCNEKLMIFSTKQAKWQTTAKLKLGDL